MTRLPDSAFWDFSLALYARPGVAAACLRLQDRRGIDVNLLFLCLWLALDHGQALDADDIARLIARARVVHEQVVKPLRTARIALKAMIAAETESLRPAIARLRAEVKRSELEAENLEQVLLAASRPHGPSVAAAARADLAKRNAEFYLTTIGAVSDSDARDLAVIIGALPPPKPVDISTT